MSKLRRKIIGVLVAVVFALLLATGLLYLPKTNTAYAIYSESNFNIIGTQNNDIYNGTATKKTFNSQLMNQLYVALTGKPNATYKDVEKSVADGDVTSATIRSYNSNQNVSVWFGGFKWDVTYITKDTSGNVILDLWQSADNISSTLSKWANSASDTPTDAYPSNMYTTSFIRVVTLNAGGFASDSNRNVSTRTEQDPDNSYGYAKFTMDNVADSLTSFIIKPANVDYQKDETSVKGNSDVQTTYNSLNEAYVAPKAGSFYSTNFDYTTKGSGETAYGYWKNDYLWLPSLAETGRSKASGASSDVSGIWKVDNNLRSTTGTNAWLRSGNNPGAHNILTLTSSGAHSGSSATATLLVRPALHLNLTAAAEAANGVTYDDNIALTTVNYTGDVVKVTIPDFKKLEVGTPMEGNATAGNKANYDKDTGEFTAQLPNNSKEVNYEIAVTPKTDYVWIGTDDSSTKYYKIHINSAPITVDWIDRTINYDPSTPESLLHTTQPSSEVKGYTYFNVKYIILNPSESLSTTKPEETDPRWREAADTDEFKATLAGMYRVWYMITAENHETLISNYTVTVSADTVTIKVSGDGVLASNVIYADTVAQSLTNEASLKLRIKQKITIVGSNGQTYDTSAVNILLDKLNIVLFTWTVNGTKNYVNLNTHGYYSVGTYYFDFQYKDPADAAISFKWETNSAGREIHPEVTIEKRDINVNIVAATDGTLLTHIYGDSPVSMKYVVPDESELADNETVDDLGLLELFVVKGTMDEIGARTNVGDYIIEGLYDEGNYSIEFEEVTYKVTKRAVTLQVADEEAEYGTDFSKYKFGTMSVADGKFVNGNSVASVTANARYYIWVNNAEMELSNTLVPDTYELRAEVKSDNYDITILAGKIIITKADFDMSGVKLENAGYLYNGKPHPAKITGTLPSSDITVTYVYVIDGEESTDAPIEIGLYTVYALFTHTSPYHNEITNKVAYLRIAATQAELDQGFPSETPDPDGVTTHPNGGGTTEDLESKKEQAKKDLEDAANKKKDEMDNDPNLTDEEKAQKKAEVDAELQKGKDAIDSATSSSGIDSAFSESKKNIEDIGFKNNGSFPWWIIAVIGGALLLLTLLIIIIIKRRNSGDDDDYYDDYYDDEYDFDEEYEEDGGDDYGETFI